MCYPNLHSGLKKLNSYETNGVTEAIRQDVYVASTELDILNDPRNDFSNTGKKANSEEGLSMKNVQNKLRNSNFSSDESSSVKVPNLIASNSTVSEETIENSVRYVVDPNKCYREVKSESTQENEIKDKEKRLSRLQKLRHTRNVAKRKKYSSAQNFRRCSAHSVRGLVTLCVASTLLATTSAVPVISCPTGCECSGSRMRCVSWAHAQPPETDRATYQELDLSADAGTTNSSLLLPDQRCPATGKRIYPTILFPCVPPPDTLGSSLDEGFLPENWLGDTFPNLTTLSLRGAGLCSMHKNALRSQTNLTSLDLSANQFKWLNVFVIRRNVKLENLSLADNPRLDVPNDGTVLYSDSLKELDLSRCEIFSLPLLMFSKMPNLESVKLSGNCLHELSTGPFTPSRAPSLARLDLSANLVQGMATAGEDATALARMSSIELSDNRWAPGCEAVHANKIQVMLANGTVTTWEYMVRQCVILVLSPETTPEPTSTAPTQIGSDELHVETIFASVHSSNQKERIINKEPEGQNIQPVIEDNWRNTANLWLTVASICMNVAMIILLTILLVNRRRTNTQTRDQQASDASSSDSLGSPQSEEIETEERRGPQWHQEETAELQRLTSC